MRQILNCGDQRIGNHTCAYCGKYADTRDHVPSKVLLDEPYPPELPVVWACTSCNNSFSADEAYFACAIDLASNNGVPKRKNIERILTKTPLLRDKLKRCEISSCSGTFFMLVDDSRVKNVVMKLARGHVLFEINEMCLEEPSYISFVPIHMLPENDRNNFESYENQNVFPEVGSRAMTRVITEPQGWINVQDGLYRYCVSWLSGIIVKIVVGEYLACQVVWK